MGEENNKNQNENQPRRFNQQQYDMLKRCSEKKNMTEWNEWREENPSENIFLEGANLENTNLSNANLGDACLEGVSFFGAHLESASFALSDLRDACFRKARLKSAELWESCLRDANLMEADLEDGNLCHAYLEGADLRNSNLKHTDFNQAHLEGADIRKANLKNACFYGAHLEKTDISYTNLAGADFETAIVNGGTRVWKCKVDISTNFRAIGLENVCIDPGTKQLLEYNIRRMNWEEWYKEHRILKWPVRLFWCFSDYGISTWRIIGWFLGLALVFAAIYYLWGRMVPPGIVDYLFADGNGAKIAWWLVPIRAIHFSVVIMTVGFTNMHANAHSFWAHILVSLQMILGFVLLGALITRFAVLFTAGGPAGKFADDNKKDADDKVS
jgi:uncharacterized protein YjbI with pentapeptide repeats